MTEQRGKPPKGNPTQSEILIMKPLPFCQFCTWFTAKQLDFPTGITLSHCASCLAR